MCYLGKSEGNCSLTSPSYLEWDALTLVMENVMCRLNVDTQPAESVDEGVCLLKMVLDYETQVCAFEGWVNLMFLKYMYLVMDMSMMRMRLIYNVYCMTLFICFCALFCLIRHFVIFCSLSGPINIVMSAVQYIHVVCVPSEDTNHSPSGFTKGTIYFTLGLF